MYSNKPQTSGAQSQHNPFIRQIEPDLPDLYGTYYQSHRQSDISNALNLEKKWLTFERFLIPYLIHKIKKIMFSHFFLFNGRAYINCKTKIPLKVILRLIRMKHYFFQCPIKQQRWDRILYWLYIIRDEYRIIYGISTRYLFRVKWVHVFSFVLLLVIGVIIFFTAIIIH